MGPSDGSAEATGSPDPVDSGLATLSTLRLVISLQSIIFGDFD